VATIYLIRSGSILARHVNFHEPLKEVPFESLNNLRLNICSSGEDTWVELNATVPVKGVLVEATGESVDEVTWDEIAVDLVPGETVRLPAKGLKQGDEAKLKVSWLGGRLL
jgi:beta-mannosidase